MPGGRPTKLTKELIDQCWEYISGGYAENDSVIPSLVGLCFKLEISDRTLYRWRNTDLTDEEFADEDNLKAEFCRMLDALQKKQQELLINNGLTGAFNSNIAKLVLAKHGYSDKQQIEQSGIDGKPIENRWIIEIVDKENTE